MDEPIEETPVGLYLDELPSWEEFAPPLEARPPAPVQDAEVVQTEEVVEDVTVVDEEGNVEVIGDVTYDCTEVPHSMAANPMQMVINDPNRDVIYPGAFIQGRTHRDGISIGDVLPLTVSKRAPIRVSIPDISTPVGDNFREVQPNQAEVAAAVGGMVGNASRNDLDTPSSISFDMQTFHSEEQFALSAGLSGRYLGFSGSASGSVDKQASTTTIAVQFTQRMYSVVVEPPGSGPESFFADDFTDDDLQALVNSGRIGPDNLPVYVSNAVYGRMMTFALTSTASESDIRAALQASYNSIAGGASVSLSAQHKSILSESSVVLTTLGGDAADALAVIRSGDWSAYFGNEAALSTAVPLSYTFKNLGDNSIASVSEATEYTVKTCQARTASPGVFEPPEAQDFTLGIGTVHEVIAADENGDGYDDLVFNHRDGGVNRVVVLRGGEDGMLVAGQPGEVPQAPSDTSWNNYALRAADVDADGDEDLVWNHHGNLCPDEPCAWNHFYVALARGGTASGSEESVFEFLPVQSQVGAGGQRVTSPFHLVDLNADGAAEPIIASALGEGGGFATRSTIIREDGSIRFVGWWDGFAGIGNPEDESRRLGDFAGDFNGDGVDDLAWNRLTDEGANGVWLATARPGLTDLDPDQVDLTNVFEMDRHCPEVEGEPHVCPSFELAPLEAPKGEQEAPSWSEYRVAMGDLDLDGTDDLVWARTDGGTVETTVALGSPTGLTQGPTDIHDFMTDDQAGDLHVYVADVGGSDGADLILNQRDGAVNRVFVGLSVGDGTFDYSSAVQDIVADEAWSQYRLVVGNFGGSSKQDVAWVSLSDDTRVYVAIAR